MSEEAAAELSEKPSNKHQVKMIIDRIEISLFQKTIKILEKDGQNGYQFNTLPKKTDRYGKPLAKGLVYVELDGPKDKGPFWREFKKAEIEHAKEIERLKKPASRAEVKANLGRLEEHRQTPKYQQRLKKAREKVAQGFKFEHFFPVSDPEMRKQVTETISITIADLAFVFRIGIPNIIIGTPVSSNPAISKKVDRASYNPKSDTITFSPEFIEKIFQHLPNKLPILVTGDLSMTTAHEMAEKRLIKLWPKARRAHSAEYHQAKKRATTIESHDEDAYPLWERQRSERICEMYSEIYARHWHLERLRDVLSGWLLAKDKRQTIKRMEKAALAA